MDWNTDRYQTLRGGEHTRELLGIAPGWLYRQAASSDLECFFDLYRWDTQEGEIALVNSGQQVTRIKEGTDPIYIANDIFVVAVLILLGKSVVAYELPDWLDKKREIVDLSKLKG